LRPVDSSAIRGGFWFARQETNRAAAIPDGSRQLRTAGNVDNLVNAAKGLPPLRAATRIDPAASGFDSDSPGYRGPLFMDSDVYKWLEAAAWEQDRSASDDFGTDSRELIKDVLAAQRTGGYLNSFVQIVTGAPWADLRVSHELYCAGHLFQAAVAAHRATGDETLLDVARRFADLLTETFGPGRSHDVDGHPLVEMALVELFRETGERRYLDLAQFAVAARGRSPHDGAYFSDRVAVRAATTLEGHAVRALYLAAGATDVAIETGDEKLLIALEAQWEDVVASKMYLTGGMGARWDGESFGDPFELPTETAYAETCAAIASIQWSWRLLLATGGARYADLIERTLFNGMLAGVSLDIKRGEVLGLVGESGSGKTTIARCVAGLHAPARGRLLLEGAPLAPLAAGRTREARRRIQIVFQNPYDSLNPRHRVGDSIARPIRVLRGLSRREAEAEVAALLERVRLPARLAQRFPGELSGGERQRVAIARALAAKPDLVVCDEITSALDVSVQAAVLELLAELRAELGLALLLITHDLGVVASVADRVLVLEGGVVCEQGPVLQLLLRPEHEYTQRLVAAAPTLAHYAPRTA